MYRVCWTTSLSALCNNIAQQKLHNAGVPSKEQLNTLKVIQKHYQIVVFKRPLIVILSQIVEMSKLYYIHLLSWRDKIRNSQKSFAIYAVTLHSPNIWLMLDRRL